MGSGFRAVLLDWRGTLVVAPTDRWMIHTALRRLHRLSTPDDVERVLASLSQADSTRVESSAIDTDARAHRAAYAEWFAQAGLDDELASEHYAGRMLHTMDANGIRIGILSDTHVDLRPVFAAHVLPDGRIWADLIEVWALSFELCVTTLLLPPLPSPEEGRLHRVLDLAPRGRAAIPVAPCVRGLMCWRTGPTLQLVLQAGA